MGVHGLWKLIESAGKPVPVETLDSKVLAVDVSIWLHQLMKGYQTPSGSNVSNAYLLGLFTRVCKLLYTNVKPVFVFDGGVPQLKKKTIAARQQQKDKSAQASEKLRQQLLKNLLKQKAVSQVLEEIRGQSSPKKKERDMFELPPLPEQEDSLSEVEEVSSNSSSEDVKPIKMKFKDLHTIDVKSAEFKDLPADIRHDILTELKETRKQNSWGRIHEMPEELGDFSKFQMSRLLKRRSVQVSLEEAEKEMGGRTLSLNDVEALLAEGGVEINPQLTKRIASDEVTRYIYVRETGEQSTSSNTNISLKETDKANFLEEQNLSFNPEIKIKEEVIDCDDLSDSELVKEVEAVEMAYMAGNIKEENIDIETEDMFEDETKTVIIDDLDLVEGTSDLSQMQILAVIRQENNKEISVTNENVPSTSKDIALANELRSNRENKDNGFCLFKEDVSDLSQTSKQSESNILNSLYFKFYEKKIKSALSDKSTNKISNDEFNNENARDTLVQDTKADKSVKTLSHLSEFPTLLLESETKEKEPIRELPCAISILELPKTNKSQLVTSHKETVCNKVEFLPNESMNPECKSDLLCLSSSESDNEFVEVPFSSNNQGLEIEIKDTTERIHDDIFADVFGKESKSSQEYLVIKHDKKSNRDSQMKHNLPVETSNSNVKNVINQHINSVVDKNPSVKKESYVNTLLGVEALHRDNNPVVPNLPAKQAIKAHEKAVQSPLPQNKWKNKITQIQNSSEKQIMILDNKKGDDKTRLQYQGNRKQRVSLFTQKQVSNQNVTNPQSSQMDSQNTKIITVHDIFKSIYCDDESDEGEEETPVYGRKRLSKNDKASIINSAYKNQSALEGRFETKLSPESEMFESINNSSNVVSSLNNQIVSSEKESLTKQTKESIILDSKSSLQDIYSTKEKLCLIEYPKSQICQEESTYELNHSKDGKLSLFKEKLCPIEDLKSLTCQKEYTNELKDSKDEKTLQKNDKTEVNFQESPQFELSIQQSFLNDKDLQHQSGNNMNFYQHLNSDNPAQKEEIEDVALTKDDDDQSKKPRRILDLKQMEKLQDILETKERELVVDQNREDRLAASLTDQMYQEAQELLRLFGVPYLVAPMEAEAQCAFLDAAGLTEGTITDDSDIWLFGARKVYKNFFDQKKFVLEFLSGDIQQYFKLGRGHLVLLALLVGSDYTVGLAGVGPVTAMEILATFPLPRPETRDSHELLVSLTRFREWWHSRPDTHAALAKKLRNVDFHEGFPSPAVVKAYLNPLVDDSREPFTWGAPDVSALRDYAERKFGWSRSRTDQVLLPAVNKLSQKSSQLTLHTFFGAIPNISAHREQMSRRVQSAVNRLEGGSEAFTPVEPRARLRPGRSRGSSRGRSGRGRAAPMSLQEDLPFPETPTTSQEVIPQREKDKAEANKRKQQAIQVLKNKSQRGVKKRRNVRQIKPEANLSESSSSDGN